MTKRRTRTAQSTGVKSQAANKPMYPNLPILIVDDEESILVACEASLLAAGMDNVVAIQDARKVMPILGKKEVSLVILDITMPHLTGEELLWMIKQEHPDLPMIVLTGLNDLDTAVRLMKGGAVDYMVKPVEDERFVSAVKLAVEIHDLQMENRLLKDRLLNDNLESPEAFRDIITSSRTMRSLFQYIESIAGTPRTALITGETGVGKELIARATHKLSRRQGRFVAVSAAGLDDNLFSDTIFGHQKGAFTGADTLRQGLIEQAAGGTLFLDEIGDLEPQSQVKLLRLLQEGEYYPLGSDIPKPSNARIIVATLHDLHAMQNEGKFRKDLYYRLRAHHILVPPLRERPEDIPCLVDHFIKEAALSFKKKRPALPPELYLYLKGYPFPGNVRELQGMVFDAVSRHVKGTLSLESFKAAMSFGMTVKNARTTVAEVPEETAFGITLRKDQHFPSLKEANLFLVHHALKRSRGNQTLAARLLGISRSALNKRIRHPRDPKTD